MPKTIFVTVGTTLFDPLIQTVSSTAFLSIAVENGYERLIIQYGKGPTPSIASSSNTSSDDGTIRGSFTNSEENTSNSSTLQWEAYRFKPTLAQDVEIADLMISHAGAGSIMEGLASCRTRYEAIQDQKSSSTNTNYTGSTTSLIEKKLVVVINDALMDNHQSELAEALEKRNYLYVLSQPRLLENCETMIRIQEFSPRIFMGGNPKTFGKIMKRFVDTCMN